MYFFILFCIYSDVSVNFMNNLHGVKAQGARNPRSRLTASTHVNGRTAATRGAIESRRQQTTVNPCARCHPINSDKVSAP